MTPTVQKGSSNSNFKLFDFNKFEGIQCKERGGIEHIQAQCANTLMKKKAMQSTWSNDDSTDSIDEEDLVGGLVVHNDGNKKELNIRDASISKALHLASCKEDTDSRLDMITRIMILIATSVTLI